MEEVVCLFCNTKSEDIFWSESGYNGRKCANCGLIYISPRPTEAEMKTLYEQGNAGGVSTSEHIHYSYADVLNARYTIRLIKKKIKSGDILEVGAGGGYFLVIAKEAGFTPYAVEINGDLCRYLNDQLHIPTMNTSAGDPNIFNEHKFDVIYFRNLLSHLHDPKGVFENLRKKVKDNGILVFETGNSGGLSKRWLRFLKYLSFPEHVYLFSEKHVIDLLTATGFRLVFKRYHTAVLSILLKRTVGSIKNAFEPKRPVKGMKAMAAAPRPYSGGQHGQVSFIKRLRGFLAHLVRYRLSRPFSHRWPSTVIYMARRTN